MNHNKLPALHEHPMDSVVYVCVCVWSSNWEKVILLSHWFGAPTSYCKYCIESAIAFILSVMLQDECFFHINSGQMEHASRYLYVSVDVGLTMYNTSPVFAHTHAYIEVDSSAPPASQNTTIRIIAPTEMHSFSV